MNKNEALPLNTEENEDNEDQKLLSYVLNKSDNPNKSETINRSRESCLKDENCRIEAIIDDAGTGWAQVLMTINLCLFVFGEGIAIISSTLIVPILEVKWKLSEVEKGFMGGTTLLGMMLGSLFVGQISDKKGRKTAFQVGNLLCLAGSLGAIFCKSALTISITNTIVGIGLAVGIPSSYSLICECCNKIFRSLVMGWCFICFPVGEICGCYIAKGFSINDTTSNDWRILLASRCIPFILCLPLMFIVVESPKFLMTQDKFNRAINVIEKLISDKLPESDVDILLTQSLVPDTPRSTFSNYSDLFSYDNLRLILSLFFLWYIVAYVYFGLIYILPTIYEDYHKQSSFKNIPTAATDGSHVGPVSGNGTGLSNAEYSIVLSDIIISCIFEIPSDICNGILPNIKGLGRKGTIILGTLMCVIFSALCLIHPAFMPLYTSFIKFFVNTAYGTLFIYTSEAYPTYLRTTSMGICNVLSRFGGFTTPFFNDALFKLANFFPFIGFVTSSLLGLVIAISLPFETLGRTLH